MKYSISFATVALSVGATWAQTATQTAIQQAETAIIQLIEETDDVIMAPKLVRLAFHDCVGGCDGCVDLGNFDNFGLDVPMERLQPIVDEFATDATGLSRTDVWVLAGLVGAEISQRNDGNQVDYPMTHVGRPVCEEMSSCADDPEGFTCNMFNGPHRELPSPDLTTDGVVHYFSKNFHFTPRQTVAIMGVHTFGVASRENSGFDGSNGWVRNEEVLDNDYYRIIVGGNSQDDELDELIDAPNWQREIVNNEDLPDIIPNRFQWERNEGGGGGRGGGRGNGGGRSRRRGGNNDIFNNRQLQPGGPFRGGGDGRGRGGGRSGVRRQGDSNDRGDNNNNNGGEGRGNGNGRERVIMLNADIALVRNFTDFIDENGVVNCEFENPRNNRPVCPHAESTIRLAALYRNDNAQWLIDFRDAFTKMVTTGCTDSTTTCTPFVEDSST